MLISCNSCNSKYLVNSAELRPDGRMVKCANCDYQWYQENLINLEDILTQSAPLTSAEKKLDNTKSSLPTPNLPSTYVRDEKVSALNSILVVLFIFILIGGFLFIRNLEVNTLVLLKFYIDEFYFNLRLIFDDIAKILHKLLN